LQMKMRAACWGRIVRSLVSDSWGDANCNQSGFRTTTKKKSLNAKEQKYILPPSRH
jgi:hypothetical protein